MTPAQLAVALGRSKAPLKARLMDQSRLAGLGNLLTDETLWRAGLSPLVAAAEVADRPGAVIALAAAIRDTCLNCSFAAVRTPASSSPCGTGAGVHALATVPISKKSP